MSHSAPNKVGLNGGRSLYMEVLNKLNRMCHSTSRNSGLFVVGIVLLTLQYIETITKKINILFMMEH